MPTNWVTTISIVELEKLLLAVVHRNSGSTTAARK